MCTSLAALAIAASLHLNMGNGNNQRNPGLAGICDHTEAGFYKNSINRESLYATYRGDWYMIGAATGYKIPIMPIAAVYHDFGPLEIKFMPAPYVENNNIRVGAVFGFAYKFDIKK